MVFKPLAERYLRWAASIRSPGAKAAAAALYLTVPIGLGGFGITLLFGMPTKWAVLLASVITGGMFVAVVPALYREAKERK